jgi:hypothetical protein
MRLVIVSLLFRRKTNRSPSGNDKLEKLFRGWRLRPRGRKERRMVGARLRFLIGILFTLPVVAGTACKKAAGPVTPPPGPKVYLQDDKMKETMVDVFPGMDGPNLNLTQNDVRGRVVWNLWVGDSGEMWDFLAQHGFGTADLIKAIDSRRRTHRFAEIGIVNQPGFQAATKPDQYGLFIDEPKPSDPDGQIDQKIDDYTYGRSSGVVGLRISANKRFDAAAKADWMRHVAPDGINHDFYENSDYFNDPNLVRPYVVGMACAFCHVGPDPVRPPADPENPKWENLNDYVGAQYFKVWEVFVPRRPDGTQQEDSFVWQIIHSNPQGTLDTSFIATDYLNNPGTMNGVYSLPARLSRAQSEHITGGALNLLHVKDPMPVPRVLKQGDDSVGFEAALSRVYVNIGEAWPEWQKHFRPLIGGPDKQGRQSPVPVDTMQRTSVYWNWSEKRSEYLAGYLVKVARPLLLKDAPGGATYLTHDPTLLERGKLVFAENCASCHSSKQPPEGTDPQKATDWFRQQVVSDPNFFTDNFLGDERRHKVTEIGTNSTRAAGTNATRGHIWDNFSSEDYKTLAPIGNFMVESPWENNNKTISVSIPLPGEERGPGYYRPPSLISLWSSAPFLHNNSVGEDFGDPSVAGRMRAFQDGIDRMLLVKPRANKVWRTSRTSYLNVPLAYIPDLLRKLIVDPRLLDGRGNLRIGPIPAGTPINLLANTNLDASPADFAALMMQLVPALVDIRLQNMNDQQAAARFQPVVPYLVKVNKCPDLVEDKGHLFGTSLPLADKKALIELLKTF